jgi:MFS family permease
MSQAFADPRAGTALGNRWWIVAASFLSLLVSAGPINIYAFGTFIGPITKEFNLSVGDFSSALYATGLFNALSVFLIGFALDRFGVRKVQIIGLPLFAASVFLYSQMTASLPVIFAVFAIAGFFGAAQTPVPYSAAITQWFDRERGLALGFACAGVGAGVVFIQWFAPMLMVNYGWRGAYMGLAVLVMVMGFVPNLLFMRDRPDLVENGRVSTDHLPGVSVGEALRDYRFWVLLVAFTLAVATINGIILHVVPMLTQRGMDRLDAIRAVQAAGLAIICGRAFSGWFLDRFWGPLVTFVFFGCSIVGMGVLVSGATGGMGTLGALLCGVGIGAEVDIMGFMLSRYFGQRNYGKIYGIVFAAFNIGTGFGPAITGQSFDYFNKSYTPILYLYMAILAVVSVSLFTLGEYRFKAHQGPAKA